MGTWVDLLDHWSSLGLSDLFILLYIGLLVLGIVVSNRLFAGFVAAKPEGRKTALGGTVRSLEITGCIFPQLN
jgi:hypothetical protein